MTSAIEVHDISKSFGENLVLDRLQLSVSQGEIFALLGPNGAGKTTTIEILTTLVLPDSGQALVKGYDVVQDSAQVKRRISVTGQSAAVDEVLTGYENLIMFGRLLGLRTPEAKDRARELLKQFDLDDAKNRRVATYSGGMRRRLDLALSIVRHPEILFLDEPTTGLDPRSRQDLWHLIRALAKGGTTIFLTTQYLEEADQLADRIAVLDHGRIVAIGSAGDLKKQVGDEYLEIRTRTGDICTTFPIDGSVASVQAALHSLDERFHHALVSIRRPTIDDVFLNLTSAPTNRQPTEHAQGEEQ